jgi:tetratricopeptide (TPR) repeat protein
LSSRPKGIPKSAIANKRGAVITCVLLAGIVWIVFGQTLGFDFVNYDDADYVYQNAIVSSGLSFSGILWAFTHVHAANWHPLTTISHMLDCQLYGLLPWGHHFTNVMLHAAVAVLLFLALCELTSAQWPSAFVAAIFAIHPLRVSSVAWIAERKDVLSGVFFMLTLWAYAWYARKSRLSSRAYIAAIVFFALGLMCKPSLVTLPFVLLLLDYWPLRRTNYSSNPGELSSARSLGSLLREKIPFFALSAASCAATLLAQKGVVESNMQLTMGGRVGNAIISYAVYVGQTFWPVNLAAIYPYPAQGVSFNAIILSNLVLVIITVNVFVWRHIAPYLLTGWLWFLGILVPMIGIIQVGNQARADRYTYLAHIGLYILLTWGAVELFNKWRHGREAMIGLAGLIITGLAANSYYETAAWRNSETLWRHALAVTKNNYIAHNNLGGALRKDKRLDEAIVEYRKALETCTSCPGVYNSLGHTFADKGDWQEAIEWYQRAIENWPRPDAGNNNNMGIALVQLGRTDEALAQFQEALRLDRDYIDVHYNLALLFKRLGRRQEAKTEFEEVLRIVPNSTRVLDQLRQLEAEK